MVYFRACSKTTGQLCDKQTCYQSIGNRRFSSVIENAKHLSAFDWWFLTNRFDYFQNQSDLVYFLILFKDALDATKISAASALAEKYFLVSSLSPILSSVFLWTWLIVPIIEA